MSLRLALLSVVFPQRIKLRMLDELARVTAGGFGTPSPIWDGRSFEARLDEYARFTAGEAGRLLSGGDDAALRAVKERLRQGAVELGADVRRRLGIKRPAEAFEAWKLLYRQLGIEVTGGLAGDIAFTRCYFTSYYSEPVCEVIGALDDGMADGLLGGAALEFTTRLTGGAACCRAVLRIEEQR